MSGAPTTLARYHLNEGGFGSRVLDVGAEKRQKKPKKKRQISANVSGTRYDVVRQTVVNLGFAIAKEDDLRNCHLIWSDVVVSTDRITEMLPFQRVNHFPGMGEICRKDCLARNMSKMQKVAPNEFNMSPRTWNLPQEFSQFQSHVKDLKRRNKRKTFIVKPANGAMGNGIRLIRQPESLTPTDHTIVQEYIGEPFLVDGFKCDMRIYVLVTKCMPLRIFIFNDGLLRLSTEAYAPPTDVNLSSLFMHLTNYSVNKHSENYEKVADDTRGSKRSLRFLMDYLRKEGHDVQELWRRISDVIIKTLIVAAPHVCHAYRMCRPGQTPGSPSVCFEVLGFDILLDKDLKPWLLEVNRSPSFGTDEKIDQEVKGTLLEDTFRLLNIKASDKRRNMHAQKRESQRRLFGGAGARPTIEYNGDIQLMRQKKSYSRNREMLRNMLLRVRKDAAEEEFENSNCGRFRRVFPPNDRFSLDHYVRLLKTALDQYSPGSRHSLHRDFEQTYQKALREDELLDLLAKCEADEELFDKNNLKSNTRTPRPLQSMPSVSPLPQRHSRSTCSFYDSDDSEEDEDEEEEEEDEGRSDSDEDARQDKPAAPPMPTVKVPSSAANGGSRTVRLPGPPPDRHWSNQEAFGGSSRSKHGTFRSSSTNGRMPSVKPSNQPRPLSSVRTRLSAVLAASSTDDNRVADDIATRGVLRSLRDHRIRFPGKTSDEADIILHKIFENWSYHKPRVASYWIMKLDSAKRRKVIDIVLSNVHAFVQKHFKTYDVESVRLYRLIKRVCNRLQWSNGQGLWQAFESTGSWETILSKNADPVRPTELSCCRRVVDLCKDCLLIVYKYAADQLRPELEAAHFDSGERPSSKTIRSTESSTGRSVEVS